MNDPFICILLARTDWPDLFISWVREKLMWLNHKTMQQLLMLLYLLLVVILLLVTNYCFFAEWQGDAAAVEAVFNLVDYNLLLVTYYSLLVEWQASAAAVGAVLALLL